MAYDKKGRFYLSAYDKAILKNTIYENPYIPLGDFTPMQLMTFVTDNKETFLAGGVGGGKSYGLLGASLQYVTEANYGALILRKTLKDLKRKNSLLNLAIQWLLRPSIKNNNRLKVKYNASEHRFTFPNGAILDFGYLRNKIDLQTYQGSSYHFIGIDEASHQKRYNYIYMKTRVRKELDDLIPLRYMGASNPGANDEWIKNRFYEKKDKDKLEGVDPLLIESNYKDNQFLDQVEYEQFLASLDPITREQLEHGNFYVTIKGKLLKHSHWEEIGINEYMKIPTLFRHRYWDMAATEESDSENDDPDYTAGVRLAVDINYNRYMDNVVLLRKEADDLLDNIVKTAIYDKNNQTVELDGATGKNFGKMVVKRIREAGIPCNYGNSRDNKVDRIKLIQPDVAEGFYVVAKNKIDEYYPWVRKFREQMTAFPSKNVHDDIPVSFAGCWLELDKRVRKQAKNTVDWSKWRGMENLRSRI